MYVTALFGAQKTEVEVGDDCITLGALKASIVAALPELCVEGFDVSVGGRALDDEGVVSLESLVCLDVSANSRGLSVLALRDAGREVSEVGLLRAAEQGDVSLVTLYLDAGVPLDCVDVDSNTPLHLSCRFGHWEIATLLLDRGSTAIDQKNDYNDTPLLTSCFSGHLSIATLLLDRGSTAIDEKNGYDYVPLHLSCRHGYLKIATLLLDRGSAMEQKNVVGDTPLHLSCGFGHLEIATLLLDRGSTVIDEKNDRGDTPLHLSCGFGHLEIATLLLDRGSTAIDEKNGGGETPLHLSCCKGHLEIATLLLDRGSTAIDEKDGDAYTHTRTRGATPLQLVLRWACVGRHPLAGPRKHCARRNAQGTQSLQRRSLRASVEQDRQTVGLRRFLKWCVASKKKTSVSPLFGFHRLGGACRHSLFVTSDFFTHCNDIFSHGGTHPQETSQFSLSFAGCLLEPVFSEPTTNVKFSAFLRANTPSCSLSRFYPASLFLSSEPRPPMRGGVETNRPRVQDHEVCQTKGR